MPSNTIGPLERQLIREKATALASSNEEYQFMKNQSFTRSRKT
jgi:translation elongation factor P/translation initiation factor 5A